MSKVCVYVKSVDIENFVDITQVEPEDLDYGSGGLKASFLVDEELLADPEILELLDDRNVSYQLGFD
jgi:hypothetical protein